ncbi:hypothetical protein DFH07DRAFT_769178 [Mycena maculata]|uniref:Uncharacterized protein n=1 Tax=Mycena maculata TaxID=230809 RepID=A0AAD7JNJ6_9AGAR|nr:hypothetical protein DFH07DRAFT_769178 [Mycena maculata]
MFGMDQNPEDPEQIGEEWNSSDKSYSSYDVVWHPTGDRTGSPHPVRFGMGIEFFGKTVGFRFNFSTFWERYIAKLPSISHVLRNQTILWVYDSALKAKTYIPDIKIPEPLSILEDQHVDLVVDRPHDPPGMDNAPCAHHAANSVAVGLFEERKHTVRRGMQKFIHNITPRASPQKTKKRKKAVLIDLPLYEYVARGWDLTNEQWRNTVWPTLDESFSDVPRSSAAWNLTVNPGTQDHGTTPEAVTVIPEVEVEDNLTTEDAQQKPGNETAMVVDLPTTKDTGRTLNITITAHSDMDSGSSASGSNTGGRIVLMSGGQESSTDLGSEGPQKKSVFLMDVEPN